MSDTPSALRASIPSAGGWAVIRRPSYSCYFRHYAARMDRVTAKMVYAEAGHASQHSRDNVIVMPDEDAARKLKE